MTKVRTGSVDTHVQRLPPAGPAAGLPADEPAPVVVLIHGLLTDSLASYYFTLGPLFAEQGMDVVMYDLRGHGRTSRPTSGYELEHFIEDLDALLDALDITRPVHLVGNSFGGSIAFGFAAAHPDRTASITAIETEPPVKLWIEHITDGLADAKRRLAMDEVIDWVAENHGAHTARLARLAGKVLQTTTMAEDIPRSRTIDENLSDVKCPVFALFGDETGLAKQVDHLQATLPGCQTVVLPDQGHSVLVERTEETARLILDWVRHSSRELTEAHR